MKPSPRRLRDLPQLSPEEQAKQDEANRLAHEKMIRELEERRKEKTRIGSILDTLEIPHADNLAVDGRELADILMDETKVKAILTKIRCKLFW